MRRNTRDLHSLRQRQARSSIRARITFKLANGQSGFVSDYTSTATRCTRRPIKRLFTRPQRRGCVKACGAMFCVVVGVPLPAGRHLQSVFSPDMLSFVQMSAFAQSVGTRMGTAVAVVEVTSNTVGASTEEVLSALMVRMAALESQVAQLRGENTCLRAKVVPPEDGSHDQCVVEPTVPGLVLRVNSSLASAR